MRTGDCPNIPNELLHRLIYGMVSAGTLDDIDREIERYKLFAKGGLTEVALRLHGQPMDALKGRILPGASYSSVFIKE